MLKLFSKGKFQRRYISFIVAGIVSSQKYLGETTRLLRTAAWVKKSIDTVMSRPYIAQFVGTLKSKSALMIFDRHANLKFKYGNRSFGCRG